MCLLYRHREMEVTYPGRNPLQHRFNPSVPYNHPTMHTNPLTLHQYIHYPSTSDNEYLTSILPDECFQIQTLAFSSVILTILVRQV